MPSSLYTDNLARLPKVILRRIAAASKLLRGKKKTSETDTEPIVPQEQAPHKDPEPTLEDPHFEI